MALAPVITQKRVNMFAPPLNEDFSASGGYEDAPPEKAKAPAPIAFDKQRSFNDKMAEYTPMQRNVMSGMSGMQAGAQVPATESTAGAVVGALGAGASGAAMGAMYGGPMGAAVGGGVGLVMGGLNAFLGNQQARRERDRIKAMNAEADRKWRIEQARDEKWRQTYRLDSLEEARYQRQKYEAQVAFERSKAQGEAMQAKINADAKLKERFQKLGW